MSGDTRPSEPHLSATTEALLFSRDAESQAHLDPSIVDVSHGEGIPIGTLGSGHSVFGRNGFSRVAFSAAPDMGPDFQSLRLPADFAFFLSEGERSYVLQQQVPVWRNAASRGELVPIDRVRAFAELPKAHYCFEQADLELDLVMSAFSPLIAHDIETSSIPVQVFDVTMRNRSSHARKFELRLGHAEKLKVRGGAACLDARNGDVAFAADGGTADSCGAFFPVVLGPGECRTFRFIVAWYFPEFRTPSPAATATYTRHYARRFTDAVEIVELARRFANGWSRAIDDWRASFDVPPEMKRLWFLSLSSVITSTMLSDDPFFFAIESPHDWVNTMDVAVYANWVYLVNWPELERMDLEQYVKIIATEGETAGFVVHSLWVDASHYAEEPTFLTRLWRAYLWFNDPSWLRSGFEPACAAASCAYRRDSFEHLLNSKQGNQSYDEWMMPGVSAYVNVAWLYALHAIMGMGRTFHAPVEVHGIPAHELLELVRTNLFRRLWSYQGRGYLRCFFRTPGSSDASVEDAIFTDQLFGRWVLSIDESAKGVLLQRHVAGALATIYENNFVDDRSSEFRGWANGMLPGRRPDSTSGYHARTCWLGTQLDLASLLGSTGEETRSLDVFRSVEKSLASNHLAVGEWNRAVDATRGVVVLDEGGKDTPRFPPYPRYTSAWEYLVCMLGLTMDEHNLYLRPFRSLSFSLRNVRLAGVRLTIRVEPNWSRSRVDGVEVTGPATLRRDVPSHHVEFLAQ